MLDLACIVKVLKIYLHIDHFLKCHPYFPNNPTPTERTYGIGLRSKRGLVWLDK
jgi:hypothetical protein